VLIGAHSFLAWIFHVKILDPILCLILFDSFDLFVILYFASAKLIARVRTLKIDGFHLFVGICSCLVLIRWLILSRWSYHLEYNTSSCFKSCSCCRDCLALPNIVNGGSSKFCTTIQFWVFENFMCIKWYLCMSTLHIQDLSHAFPRAHPTHLVWHS